MRSRISKWWPYAACLLLYAMLAALAYLLGRAHGKAQANAATAQPPTVTVETRRDTIMVRQPRWTARRVLPDIGVKWDDLNPPDITIGEADSLHAATTAEDGAEMPDTALSRKPWATIPLEQKEYNSGDFSAWVSGYRPSLDSIRIHTKTVSVTQNITQTGSAPGNAFGNAGNTGGVFGKTGNAGGVLRERVRVGLSLGAGCGVFTRKPDIYAGFAITWQPW